MVALTLGSKQQGTSPKLWYRS